MGYYRNARHAGLGGVGQEVCRLQEFVVILDPDHPVLGKDRIIPGIGTRQRCRMRACRPGSQFRTTDLDEDDRLAALCGELCDFEKFIGSFEAFDKAGDYPRIRIVQQIAGEIGKVEVCLVSLPTYSLTRPQTTRAVASERGRAR